MDFLARVNRPGTARLLAAVVLLACQPLLLSCAAEDKPRSVAASPTISRAAPASAGGPVSKDPPALLPSKNALIIGNGAYRRIGALDNPENDARLMNRALSKIGFATELRLNLTVGQSVNLIRNFLQNASAADVNIIYYAGHAVQINGENYLVPVDFAPSAASNPSDMLLGMIRISELVRAIENSGARKTVIILDACRDNPFARAGAGSLARSAGSGLALPPPVLTNRSEIFFLYSTAPGQVALDGDDGNSPFTKSLAQWITDPRRTFEDVVRATIRDVSSATLGAQVPWSSSNFSSELRLFPKEVAPVWRNISIFNEFSGEGDLTLKPDIWRMIDANTEDSRNDAAWKNVDDIRYVAVSEDGDRANVLTCQGIGSRCHHQVIAKDTVDRCETRGDGDCGLYAVIRNGELSRIWRGEIRRARGSRAKDAFIAIQLEWEKIGPVTGRINFSSEGQGEIVLTMVREGVRCSGIYKFAPGQVRGKFNGSCADGTNFTGNFVRNSPNSYYARGTDSRRRKFNGIFSIAHSDS